MKRLPISLKVDEKSDFYQDFIKEKKNNLELSPFIIDLLEAYYESEKVKKSVEEHLMKNNPYVKIQERIDKIKVEYNKQAMGIEMVGDFNTNAKKKYNQEKEKKRKEEKQPEENKEKPKELTQLEELKELDRLTKKFGIKISSNNELGEKNIEVKKQTEEKINTVKKEVMPEIEEEVEEVEEIEEIEEIEEVEEVEVDKNKEKDEEKTVEVVKTPASFNNLLNSV
jgi:hypothetical protein